MNVLSLARASKTVTSPVEKLSLSYIGMSRSKGIDFNHFGLKKGVVFIFEGLLKSLRKPFKNRYRKSRVHSNWSEIVESYRISAQVSRENL